MLSPESSLNAQMTFPAHVPVVVDRSESRPSPVPNSPNTNAGTSAAVLDPTPSKGRSYGDTSPKGRPKRLPWGTVAALTEVGPIPEGVRDGPDGCALDPPRPDGRTRPLGRRRR